MKSIELRLPYRLRRRVLAVGIHTKNTLCYAYADKAYVTALQPDLGEQQDYLRFVKTAGSFLKGKIDLIACDLHPQYRSTVFASSLQEKGFRLRKVQHHHAHIASCMAEAGLLHQRVIGIAFDGTGLGSDGTLWGAEFLICGYRDFIRRAHLRYVPLAGAATAISQPWRVAAFWLEEAYGARALGLRIPFTSEVDKDAWRLMRRMHKIRLNTPMASSMGRLFDAAASIILKEHYAHYEGELAVRLEKVASRCRSRKAGYPLAIVKEGDTYIVDPVPLFKALVRDLGKGVSLESLAYGFHASVASLIHRVTLLLHKETGIRTVALSGGVFQNNLLLSLALDLLYKERLRVLLHRRLPVNDACVSLGQAVVAASQG